MAEFDVEGWAGVLHGSQCGGSSMGQWRLHVAQSVHHLAALYGNRMSAKSNQHRIAPEQH